MGYLKVNDSSETGAAGERFVVEAKPIGLEKSPGLNELIVELKSIYFNFTAEFITTCAMKYLPHNEGDNLFAGIGMSLDFNFGQFLGLSELHLSSHMDLFWTGGGNVFEYTVLHALWGFKKKWFPANSSVGYCVGFRLGFSKLYPEFDVVEIPVGLGGELLASLEFFIMPELSLDFGLSFKYFEAPSRSPQIWDFNEEMLLSVVLGIRFGI